MSQRPPNGVLSYERPPSRWRRRALWIFTAACLIYASVLLCMAKTHSWRFWPHSIGSNAPLSYPEDVGAYNALGEIQFAVIAYAEANSGTLPGDLSKVKPFLRNRVSKYPVTPEMLLPHVILISAVGKPTTFPIGGKGRFLLMVHLLGAGPMTFNRTHVIAEDGYETSYRDQEVTAAFGNARLQQLKQQAYQLP